MLRYQECNQLHKDFHGALNTTVEYISRRYGVAALRALFRRTGREVYASIRRKLSAGDPSELLEHLVWFHQREGGGFNLDVQAGRITFEVKSCPAIRHLRQLGLTPSEHICVQTVEINAGMCEGTPWRSTVEILSEGHCRQCFIREGDHAAE